MKSKTELSIIIVSWNVKDLLQQALYSIYNTKQHIDYEVIVIDNASTDDSAKMVADNFPQVKLIINKINAGFALGCNQGAKISQGEYLLFLNDDTKIFDNCLDKCVSHFKSNPNIGVLGCSIKNYDGSQQLSVRRFPSLLDQIIILLKIHNFFPRLIKNYLMLDFDYNRTQSVDQVMGAFFLTNQQIYNKLQGFDEKYYFWFEEVDYCKRVKNLGLKVVYFSETNIIHYGGSSFKQWKACSEQRLLNNSLIHYFFKHKPKYQFFIILLFIPFSLVLAYIVSILEKFNLNPKNKK